MGECQECDKWCNDKYEFCWTCNQETIDQKCEDCGITFYGERWKTQCRNCWFEEQNEYKDKYKPLPKNKTDKEQTKLDKFFI